MNRNTQVRISTGKLNTVRDLLAGTLVQNNTGVSQYQGQLSQKYRFDEADVAKHWDTTLSAAPTTDVEVQYIQVISTAPVAPARGVLAYWAATGASKPDIVTTDDTLGTPVAGVFMGTMAAGEFGFIAKLGEVAVKFKSSTTKATPVIGDDAVAVSGNSGLADVLADATAQTYATDRTNQKIGRLITTVTAQIAIVALDIRD